MVERSFDEAVATLKNDLDQVELPVGSDARFNARQRAMLRRRTLFRFALAMPAIAAILLGAFIVVREDPHPPGFVLAESEDLEWRLDNDVVEIVAGHATLEARGLGATLAVDQGSRLRRTKKNIGVLRGRVVVAVERRPQTAEPLGVEVSHGVILVLGTRFTVEQRDDGGTVTLHNGKVRFVASDGRRVDVTPGETLHWPLPGEPNETEQVEEKEEGEEGLPPSKVERRKPKKSTKVGPLLAELERLRIRGRYQELVERITRALPTIESKSLREELSYERCDVLAHRLSERRRACTCTAQHSRQFPNSGHATLIDELRAALQCPTLYETGPAAAL